MAAAMEDKAGSEVSGRKAVMSLVGALAGSQTRESWQGLWSVVSSHSSQIHLLDCGAVQGN